MDNSILAWTAIIISLLTLVSSLVTTIIAGIWVIASIRQTTAVLAESINNLNRNTEGIKTWLQQVAVKVEDQGIIIAKLETTVKHLTE